MKLSLIFLIVFPSFLKAQFYPVLGATSKVNRFVYDSIASKSALGHKFSPKSNFAIAFDNLGNSFRIGKDQVVFCSDVYRGSWKGKKGKWIQFIPANTSIQAPDNNSRESYILLKDMNDNDSNMEREHLKAEKSNAILRAMTNIHFDSLATIENHYRTFVCRSDNVKAYASPIETIPLYKGDTILCLGVLEGKMDNKSGRWLMFSKDTRDGSQKFVVLLSDVKEYKIIHLRLIWIVLAGVIFILALSYVLVFLNVIDTNSFDSLGKYLVLWGSFGGIALAIFTQFYSIYLGGMCCLAGSILLILCPERDNKFLTFYGFLCFAIVAYIQYRYPESWIVRY